MTELPLNGSFYTFPGFLGQVVALLPPSNGDFARGARTRPTLAVHAEDPHGLIAVRADD